MREVLGNLPVTWAGMTATYHDWPAGRDLTPMHKGLPDDMCPCPHWGYVIKGSLHMRYTDGAEEVIEAGEACYMPPGHTSWTEEPVSLVLFSPEEEWDALVQHMRKRREELRKE